MGFYSKYVLPRIIETMMRDWESSRLRAAWVPKAPGTVLEVGIGSGLNLPFYSSDVTSSDVTRIYGVDPSRGLQNMARERTTKTPLTVEFFTQSAENPLPLEGKSIDTIVITWASRTKSGPRPALLSMFSSVLISLSAECTEWRPPAIPSP